MLDEGGVTSRIHHGSFSYNVSLEYDKYPSRRVLLLTLDDIFLKLCSLKFELDDFKVLIWYISVLALQSDCACGIVTIPCPVSSHPLHVFMVQVKIFGVKILPHQVNAAQNVSRNK